MKWLALSVVIVGLLAILAKVQIDHGDGLIRLAATIEVSSASGERSGLSVDLLHRYGGAFGIPRTTRHHVCVTDKSGRCAGKLDYRFASETIQFARRSWPKPEWWIELSSPEKTVATYPLPASGGYLSGVPYYLAAQVP